MAFVTRLGGNVVTYSINADGRIVCVCSIDRDVSAWSKPRYVVSWDIFSYVRQNETRRLAPFRVIYHGVVWMPGEIKRDTCVAQICAGTTTVKRSSAWIKDSRMNCADQEPSQKELTSFISNQIPEN